MRERLELRLSQVAGLSERDIRHLVDEIYDLFNLTLDEFVTRRHEELQQQGYRTDVIYGRILEDLAEWRFAAPALTLRQVRRRIYG